MDDKEKTKFSDRINCPQQKRDKSFQRYSSPDYVHYEKLRDRISWIESRLIGPRMLDVGCGSGLICYTASRREDITEIHGLDLQDDMIAQATQNVKSDKVHFHSGFAEEMPFGDGYFDVVVMGEALEHVFSDKDAVAEAARVLKQNGRIVITVPNRGRLSFCHIRIFNGRYLVNLLKPYFNIKEKSVLHNFLICMGEKR